MNNKLKLENSWDKVKERLKENNIELTDDDLQYTPGQEDELLERLSKKLHKNKDETKALVESLSANEDRAS
jgi:uncharacterized protein YjbJ (UPF0337 family)